MKVIVKQAKVGEQVYTPLGKGRVVLQLRDGSYVVEFAHGGGHIFTGKELNGSLSLGDAFSLCSDPDLDPTLGTTQRL